MNKSAQLQTDSETLSSQTPDLIVSQVKGIRPSWDRPGILKAVRAALNTYPIAVVRKAAIEAAGDRLVKTPGAIDARCQHITERQRRADRAAGSSPAPATRWPASLPANHCGNSQCTCEHGGCFAGWIGDERPCPECRPGLSARWVESHTPRRHSPAGRTDQTSALLADVRNKLAARRTSTTPKGRTA